MCPDGSSAEISKTAAKKREQAHASRPLPAFAPLQRIGLLSQISLYPLPGGGEGGELRATARTSQERGILLRRAYARTPLPLRSLTLAQHPLPQGERGKNCVPRDRSSSLRGAQRRNGNSFSRRIRSFTSPLRPLEGGGDGRGMASSLSMPPDLIRGLLAMTSFVN